MNKKLIVITTSVLSLLLLIGGVTYAFYEWVSGTNTDISFDVEGLRVRYEGGTDITGVNLIPTDTKEEGVLKSVEVELDSNQVITPAPSLSLFLDLTLFPSDLADASFKWEVYRNDETTALTDGNFSGRQQGDSIELINNQSITSTKDTYKIYLWIDGNEENNSNMQNQTFTFTLHATGANSILGIYYELEGIIYKEDGSVCSLCDVTMHSDPIETTTTADGYYYFEEVPVGRHTLIVEDNGTEIINDKFVLRKGEESSITNKEVTLSESDAITFRASSDTKISQINIKNQDSLIVRKNDTFNYFQGTNLDIKELFNIDSLITSGGATVCTEGNTTITNISSLSNGVHTVRCTATTQLGVNQISSVTINVDNVIPTITAINNTVTEVPGTSKNPITYFNVSSYSYTGGTTECKIGNDVITNISNLEAGTYTITCSMTTGVNRTASASTSLSIVVPYTGMAKSIKDLAVTNINEIWTITQPATIQVPKQVTEYRYYGATPNNYVWYNCKDIDNNGKAFGVLDYTYSTTNCELWRIIGVFETETPVYTNGSITSYKTENRVKIIRDESLGKYSWDSSVADVNDGQGINAWDQADLMTTLNSGAYWNRTSGTCYNDAYNSTTPCNFSTTGLNGTAKDLVEPAKYYFGGTNGYQLTSVQYTGERGTTYKSCSSVTYCNDTYNRQGTWTGVVGLMYGSDYGYAAGSTCANSTKLGSYDSTCKSTDWLYKPDLLDQWTLSINLHPISATQVFIVYSGMLTPMNTYSVRGVRPVLYLSSDVVIKDGLGTSNSPFIIG